MATPLPDEIFHHPNCFKAGRGSWSGIHCRRFIHSLFCHIKESVILIHITTSRSIYRADVFWYFAADCYRRKTDEIISRILDNELNIYCRSSKLDHKIQRYNRIFLFQMDKCFKNYPKFIQSLSNVYPMFEQKIIIHSFTGTSIPCRIIFVVQRRCVRDQKNGSGDRSGDGSADGYDESKKEPKKRKKREKIRY